MASIEKGKFKVRDLRKKEQFIIDDAYLNGWAKVCGSDATLVYVSLCRHADKNQSCFPSQFTIAKEHSIKNTGRVRRGIKQLLTYNIIKVEKVRNNKGRYLNCVYYLLDQSEWKMYMCQNRPTKNKESHPCAQNPYMDTSNVVNRPTKDAHLKKDINQGVKQPVSLHRPLSFTSFLNEYPSETNVEGIECVAYFLDRYKVCRKEEHPYLKPEQWQKAIDNILSVSTDRDSFDLTFADVKKMIDKYFQTKFQNGCNYSLLHFISEGVKMYRFLEEVFKRR